MAVLYIAGSAPGVGKTALATAIATQLTDKDTRTALVRPIRIDGEGSADPDALFFRRMAPSPQGGNGWPVPVQRDALEGDVSLPARVRETVTAASGGSAVTIVEGLDGLEERDPAARASGAIARELNARVVVLLEYRPDLGEAEARAAARQYGEQLVGVIVNRVPRYASHNAAVQASAIQANDVPVLGVLPEDRRMLAPSVGQIAEHLGAEFRLLPQLEEPEQRLDALVEYFMVGGWPLDNGAFVFSRRANKAVIIKAERPDLQMAALETSTACLVLTGGREPVQYITYQAEQRQVPMMVVETPTLEVMESLDALGGQATVHNPLKALRFAELLEEHCDTQQLLSPLLIH